MTTASDTLAQLEELWESAEKAQPEAGDAYIRRAVRDEISYEVGVAERPILSRDYRVIERAKPKPPEWEAVVASYIEDEENRRQVFAKTPGGNWESYTRYVHADELVDPVPLVEMPEREALVGAIRSASPTVWPLEGGALADAVLELLEGKREA